MKTVFNNLLIFAVMAATVSAFAFNAPDDNLENTKRFFDPDTQELGDDITEQVLGVDYLCTAAEKSCTIEIDPSGQMVPESRVNGEYQPIQ